MAIPYMGAVVLEVNGREVEVTEFSVNNNTGRKPVKTMNSTGRAKGYCSGIETFELSLTVAMPLGDTAIDWENVVGAKLTQYPVGGGQQISYLDCFTTEVDDQYSVDNEARISIKMNALNKVTE